MSRTSFVASLAFASLLVSGCAGGESGGGSRITTNGQVTTEAQTTTGAGGGAATITLRGGRLDSGPWRRDVSLTLGKGGVPVNFYVCGVWSHTPPQDPCRAVPGDVLPQGATMRLEQRPIGPAVKRADSPGWGLVGTSEAADLNIPLSSFVSGNRPGPVTYRVTLRNGAGRVLTVSNTITITWHE